jgi:hypothetical protein
MKARRPGSISGSDGPAKLPFTSRSSQIAYTEVRRKKACTVGSSRL